MWVLRRFISQKNDKSLPPTDIGSTEGKTGKASIVMQTILEFKYNFFWHAEQIEPIVLVLWISHFSEPYRSRCFRDISCSA